MISRHHLVLGLLCGLVAGPALTNFDLPETVAVLAGTAAGVLLPDIHMKRPRKICPRTAAWCIAQVGRRAYAPAVCRLAGWTHKVAISPDDKRLTHSLPGFAALVLFIALPLAAAGLLLPLPPGSRSLLFFFLEGLLLGLVLHLAADLCTRKGIPVAFPFSEARIRGSIRPCDTADPRIRRFHIQHGIIAAAFLAAAALSTLPAGTVLPAGILCTGACAGSMICQAGVRIEYGAARSPAPGKTAIA